MAYVNVHDVACQLAKEEYFRLPTEKLVEEYVKYDNKFEHLPEDNLLELEFCMEMLKRISLGIVNETLRLSGYKQMHDNADDIFSPYTWQKVK